MIVYLAYIIIDQILLDKCPYIIDMNNVIYYGENFQYAFYGWTTNKNLIREFKDTRNSNIFKFKKIELDMSDYIKFKGKNYLYEIFYNLLEKNEVLTFIEHQLITEYKFQLIDRFLNESLKIKISVISKKYQSLFNNQLNSDPIHLFLIIYRSIINDKFIERIR